MCRTDFGRKVLGEDHTAAAPTKLNRKIYAEPHRKYCVFRVFLLCQLTFNKFISQQKHHSAELSTTARLVSFFSSFFLCFIYNSEAVAGLRNKTMAQICTFFSFLLVHAFLCLVQFLLFFGKSKRRTFASCLFKTFHFVYFGCNFPAHRRKELENRNCT